MNFDDYDYVGPFREGAVRVKKDGLMWHIDKKGKELYKERFDWVGRFRDGVACVEKNGKYFPIDEKGKELYKERFDSVGNCIKARSNLI